MSNNRYEFKVNRDKTVCKIFLKRPAGKLVGEITLYPNKEGYRELYEDGVMWLPVNSALAALGIRSDEQEEQTMKELGY